MRVAASLCFALLLGFAHAPTNASSSLADQRERRAVLDAARAHAQAQLRERPVRFLVKQWRRSGDWIFLHAAMQDPQGQPISYADTRYEAADRRGQKSADYDALLQRRPGRWYVRVDSIGATDVPWTNWGRDYGAPPELFPGG